MDSNDLKNFEILTPIIKEGDILVDIGANYGDYTDFFKRCLNGTGKIYSVELHPDTFKFLHNKLKCLIYNITDTNLPLVIPFSNNQHIKNISNHPFNHKLFQLQINLFI